MARCVPVCPVPAGPGMAWQSRIGVAGRVRSRRGAFRQAWRVPAWQVWAGYGAFRQAGRGLTGLVLARLGVAGLA